MNPHWEVTLFIERLLLPHAANRRDDVICQD